MGLFDLFRKKKTQPKGEDNNFTFVEETPTPVDISSNIGDVVENISDNSEELINENNYSNIDDFQGNVSDNSDELATKNNYSTIVPNEVFEKIAEINNIEYISDIMVEKIEKYPKLVDLLLEGNILQDIIFLLSYEEKLTSLPFNEEGLRFIEFFELDEKTKKLVSLLKNEIDYDSIGSDYQGCYVDLKELEPVEFQNVIDSLIPNIKINLGSEKLTKTSMFSNTKLYFPKTKNKIVYHDFEKFIAGNIELNEEIIVQMLYSSFYDLDETIIDKISNCKIVLSPKELQNNIDEYTQCEVDYELVKYNHLIYVTEKSSLNSEMKEKLVYQIKNIYSDGNIFFDFEVKEKILPFLEDLDIEEVKKLTNEFNLDIEEYREKLIEKPAFNAKFYIDENFNDFDNMSISNLIYHINKLPDDLKVSILQEPRVLEKLNISDKLDESQLKQFIYLLSTRLSPTTMKFVKSLGFDVKKFMSNSNNDYKNSFDINPIVSKYGVYDSFDEEVTISVADLVGHDYVPKANSDNSGMNILRTFEKFFEEGGDDYHSRSLELLEYESGEQLLKGLERRNRDTTNMLVREIEDGKYIISSNGLHRFTVLRFHYLLDCMKNEKSEEELREMYKIPVRLTSKTNFKKTYCNYLIQKANPDISFISFYCDANTSTIYYDSKDESETVDEEELLDLARKSVDTLDSDSLSEVQHFYDKFESFHNFMDRCVPNFSDELDASNKGGIKL